MEQPPLEMEITLPAALLRIFFPLLQEGVSLEVRVGVSIKQLLTEQFGIAADYLAGRVTTVFLNSKAVDDMAKALVQNDAVLALSGAMPGLVGATMRSGGYYAAMRGAMTYQDDGGSAASQRGRIKLKLFNLLLEELGPRVLRKGILLEGERFQNFLAAQPEDFRLLGCRVDGQSAPQELRELASEGRLIKLKVDLGEQS